ncbi:MAG TPA: PQQ-binding-like beta-propeller repeat protein [Thermomicrobiales bacterium]|nr:PQQ-binding-like beta-propeller repeat protein [Thermomicrobiales bacterium]
MSAADTNPTGPDRTTTSPTGNHDQAASRPGPTRTAISRRPLLAALALAPVAGAAGVRAGTGTPVVGTPAAGTPMAGTPTAGTPAAGAPGGWPLYGHDLSGNKAATGSGLSVDTVAGLELAWSVEVGGAVSATPVIANGVAIFGSYDGNLYAVDLLTGEEVWTYETGVAVLERNLQIDLGIVGSAAAVDGVVYVGDAAANLHAVDAATGEEIWTVLVDEQPNACIWSSPVVWEGTVYVGVASIAKEVGFRGGVVAVDAVSGEVLWHTFMVPEGRDGAGVFSVPAIDPDRGMVFVGTQNAYTENPAPYGDTISIVALQASSGEIVWTYAAPPNDGETAPVEDVGLSASPHLFSVEIDGEMRDLVGEGQKSGVYWALDRDSGEVVWESQISPAGFLGGMEGTSAYADGIVAVPATDWPEFDGPATGMVTALDATTGEPIWTALQDAPAASPVGIADGIVFHAGLDGILHAYDLTTGDELWSYDLGGSASGGVAIANGVVVVGAATPLFAPFIRPGNTVQAFALP